MKNSLCALFLAVGTFLSFNVNGQNSGTDSLKGFDERAFINSAVIRGASGQELKDGLKIAKKEFVYSKYYQPGLNIAAAPSLPHVTVVQPSCTNMDFETGTFFGWDQSRGTVSNSQTMAGCCPTIGAPESAIINTTSTPNDPIVPALSLASPLGGTYVARVNNSATGSVVNRMSQTFSVTTTNSAFQLAFASVLQSAGNHVCNTQPNINITLRDSANNVLTCPYLSFSAPSPSCPNGDPLWIAFGNSTTGGHYRDWTLQTIDLQRYIGTAITIEITVSDCTASGHYGYAYFDMKCVPLEITSNGIPYNVATQTSVYISPCGATSAIIAVPDGLGPYLWQGPATSTVSGATTPTVNTNVAGDYTVTMSPPGACPLPGNPSGTITKIASLRFTPSPTATAMVGQPSCSNATGSGQINVNGGTGPYTFSWTPAASNSDLANGLTPGTSYTIVVTDSMGCKDTTSLAVDPFSDAPTFTITPLNGVLTCNTPSLTLSAITGTNTTGVWTGTTTSTIDVYTAGTYTAILTNTASVGQCSTSVNVTVTGNTVQPTATYTVSCNTTVISLDATSQPGIALGWLAPTLPSPTPVSNPGSSTASGVFTLTATNLTTGCKSTYLVPTSAPDILVTTVPSRTVTCHNPTVTATASSTVSGVVTTWLSGTTTYTDNPIGITTAGTYTAIVTAPSGCATQSVITIISDKTDLPGITVSTNPSDNIITCTNPVITATGSSTTTGTSITWNSGSSTFTTNPLPISTPGTYTATATDAGGCVSRNVFVITQNNTANVLISSTSHTIPCLTNNLELLASSSPAGSYTYSWIPSNPSFVGNPFNVSDAGTYTVIAYNTTNGCVASNTYSVTKETVTAQFSANPSTGLMPLPVTLTNQSVNGEEYLWNLGNSSTTFTTVNASTIYDFQGTYTVTLITTKGYCSDTASATIIVDMVSFITIPNVFTPNGDGKNDIFSLNPINIGDISMTIFDRWGLKMYDTTSTGSLTWDGKTKAGADVADGTYFYIITAKGLDGKDFNFQGTVNIFR